jgi:hypothetical protein
MYNRNVCEKRNNFGGLIVEKYDEYKFKTYLWRVDLHGAVDYLSKFEETKKLYDKYIDLFEKGNLLTRTDNPVIDKIDKIYQVYYRKVFWQGVDNNQAKKELYIDLGKHFDMPIKEGEDIEDEVVKVVEKENYNCLCGDTQGFLGPYIWESSTEEKYRVELPNGVEGYKLVMMDNFISRSWLDFISFGKTGAGGWARKDGILCCVRKCYDTKTNGFIISFLKHEAQHTQDIKKYVNITPTELEYRAKLIELIYWPDVTKIKYFYDEASNKNLDNTHSMASYLIIENISKELFNSDYLIEEPDWNDKVDEIQSIALVLLKRSNEELESKNKK